MIIIAHVHLSLWHCVLQAAAAANDEDEEDDEISEKPSKDPFAHLPKGYIITFLT